MTRASPGGLRETTLSQFSIVLRSPVRNRLQKQARLVTFQTSLLVFLSESLTAVLFPFSSVLLGSYPAIE